VTNDVLVETFIPGSIVRHYVESASPCNKRIAQEGLMAYLQMLLVVRGPCLQPPDVSLSPPVASIRACLSSGHSSVRHCQLGSLDRLGKGMDGAS
jgi:hypothetical protein